MKRSRGTNIEHLHFEKLLRNGSFSGLTDTIIMGVVEITYINFAVTHW